MKRISELDGLRGLAVLLVFAVHIWPEQCSGAFIGVDIFFALSGFLITRLMLAEYEETGGIAFRKFYMRRVLRIAPALITFAGVYVLLTLTIIPYAKEHILAALASLCAMNFVRAYELPYQGFVGHTWSLGIEEQFYIFWPVLFLAALRCGRRIAIASTCALIVAIMLWRGLLLGHEASPDRLYNGVDVRADSLLVGCLLAIAWSETLARLAGRTWTLPAAFLAYVICTVHYSDGWLSLGGFSLIAVAAAWIVAALLSDIDSPLKSALGFEPLVRLGRISYGFYLWHFLMINVFLAKFPGTTNPQVAIPALMATLLLAMLSYNVVEKPALRLKNRRYALPVPNPVASP